MRIAVPRERRAHECRVAATPDSVRKLVNLGAEVVVESGAGAGASIPDEHFRSAGAALAADHRATLGDADIVFKVQRPLTAEEGGPDELGAIKSGAVLIGLLAPSTESAQAYARQGIAAFALEFLPRITRAQPMDALSSQSSLAGYRAVIDAACEYGRGFPMMMTAAGTVPPTRLVVLGAGVAGLQAIATARRLGAVVTAFDVRIAAKEQVESLGARFLSVESTAEAAAETAAGYAREMGEDYKRRQAEVIHAHLKTQDVAVCAALIPGKPAPVLVTEAMVKDMKPGSVIIDLAADSGGNCALTERGKVVAKHGVKIIGHPNLASRIATDSSALYARNLVAFLTPMVDPASKSLKIDWDDEIIKGTLLTRDGRVVHPALQA